jgi:hypothetical protein
MGLNQQQRIPVQSLGHVLLAWVFTFLLSAIGQAHWPTVEIHSFSKIGGQVGTTIDVAVNSGKHLNRIEHLVSSNGKINSTPIHTPLDPNTTVSELDIRHQVAMASDLPVGFYDIRGHGSFGLSNARRFWVTREPWRYEAWRASSPTWPIVLYSNEIRQDRVEVSEVNHYRIAVDSPGRLTIDFVCDAVDSRVALVGKLSNPRGSVLRTFSAREQVDSPWQFDVEQPGDYYLAVHDQLFRGGNEFAFAVRWRVDSATAAEDDFIERWRAIADSVAQQKKLGVNALGSLSSSTKLLSLRPPLVSSLPIIHQERPVESEANQSIAETVKPIDDSNPESITSVSLPALVVGKFDNSRDEDWFQADFVEKTAISFEVISDRLAEPTDPTLTLFRVEAPETGQESLFKIAASDDLSDAKNRTSVSAVRDPVIHVVIPTSGRYRWLVRNQQRLASGSAAPRYAMEVRPSAPGFRLLASFELPGRDPAKFLPMSPTLIRDGIVPLTVRAYRFDNWQGPIDVKLDNLPRPLVASPITINSPESLGHCLIQANSDLQSDFVDRWLSSVNVRGEGNLHGLTTSTEALYGEFIWGPTETVRRSTFRLTSSMNLALRRESRMPMVVALGKSSPMVVAKRQPFQLPILIRRTTSSQPSVTLRLRDLPNGITAKEASLEPGKDEGQIEVQVADSVSPGEYSIWALCEAKVKLSENEAEQDLQFPSLPLAIQVVESIQ